MEMLKLTENADNIKKTKCPRTWSVLEEESCVLMLFNHPAAVTTDGARCSHRAALFSPPRPPLMCWLFHFHLCVWWSCGRHLLNHPDVSASSYLPRLCFPLWNSYINSSYELSGSLYIPFLWEISHCLSPIRVLTRLSVSLSMTLSVFLRSFLSSSSSSASAFSAISDPSLSSLLPPCGCSHFLTLPRTRHTQPIDDPQKDPR